MTLVQAIAKRTQTLLDERGIKQYTLHKQGGIPRPTLSSLVNAKEKTVKLDTLYQVASTLGISLKEFFDDPIFDEVTD